MQNVTRVWKGSKEPIMLRSVSARIPKETTMLSFFWQLTFFPGFPSLLFLGVHVDFFCLLSTLFLSAYLMFLRFSPPKMNSGRTSISFRNASMYKLNKSCEKTHSCFATDSIFCIFFLIHFLSVCKCFAANKGSGLF